MPGSVRQELDGVVAVLGDLRLRPGLREEAVVAAVKARLDSAGIAYRAEVKLGPRSRIDLLTAGGVGIEVKQGKPNSRQVWAQLERYAASAQIAALVVVVSRNIAGHGCLAGGKPVRYVALNRNWGIAL
jgi:hypothetical protein